MTRHLADNIFSQAGASWMVSESSVRLIRRQQSTESLRFELDNAVETTRFAGSS